jgi:hypothetical protein
MGPLAGLLPMANYADQLANPNIFLSPALIRQVFPHLLVFNGIVGLLCLRWLPRMSVEYSTLVESDPEGFTRSWWTWLILWVRSVGILFIGPALEIDFDLQSKTLSLIAYIASSIAPSLLVIGSYQLAAMMWTSGRESYFEAHRIAPAERAGAPKSALMATRVVRVARSADMQSPRSELDHGGPRSNLKPALHRRFLLLLPSSMHIAAVVQTQ